ncbi:MAG: methyltransferase domain-containing protein [Sandaracinaceae bacterium]|nr:methyltransferase domain-containing protein [Sandaracinaceae bacterium]
MSLAPHTDASAPKRQIDHWTGEFGNAYVARNPPSAHNVRLRTRALAPILARMDGEPPRSILECGCNVGLNLRALAQLTEAEIFGLEPNRSAREMVRRDGVLDPTHLVEGTLGAIPFPDASIDLVFTSGVLIHVPPAELTRAIEEVHRVSRRYVLAIEYFSPKPEAVPYRGHSELLWKRDFGGAYLDRFPSLVPIDTGFLWSRTSGCDDATWWLFRKG